VPQDPNWAGWQHSLEPENTDKFQLVQLPHQSGPMIEHLMPKKYHAGLCTKARRSDRPPRANRALDATFGQHLVVFGFHFGLIEEQAVIKLFNLVG
jgi:hypothetical protein